MLWNQPATSESITYFFTRSKDVYEENGTLFVTLFARLTREFIKTGEHEVVRKVESTWVDIEEVKLEDATEKMKKLPNGLYRYNISKEVFLELVKASVGCPKELYYVTPFSTSR